MLVAGPWPTPIPQTGADPSWWPPGTRTADDDSRVAAYTAALAFFQGSQWQERPLAADLSPVLRALLNLAKRYEAVCTRPSGAGAEKLRGDAGEGVKRLSARWRHFLWSGSGFW